MFTWAPEFISAPGCYAAIGITPRKPTAVPVGCGHGLHRRAVAVVLAGKPGGIGEVYPNGTASSPDCVLDVQFGNANDWPMAHGPVRA